VANGVLQNGHSIAWPRWVRELRCWAASQPSSLSGENAQSKPTYHLDIVLALKGPLALAAVPVVINDVVLELLLSRPNMVTFVALPEKMIALQHVLPSFVLGIAISSTGIALELRTTVACGRTVILARAPSTREGPGAKPALKHRSAGGMEVGMRDER